MIPVDKNGKFFGYADADQIAKHPELTEVKAPAAKDEVAEEPKDEPKGAKPAAIKKAPPKK